MPVSNVLKSIMIITFGALVGYGSTKIFMNEPIQKNRTIASYPITKLGQDQNARFLFDIKINTDGLAPREDEVTILKANIQALKNFGPGLVYTWNLPNDITLVEGKLTEDLGDFSANQTREFMISVRGFSKQQKKFVSFEIKGQLESRSINREILISSRPEDSFEYLIQQQEKKRKDQPQKPGLGIQKNKFSPEHVIR